MQFLADHPDDTVAIIWHANFPYPLDPFYAHNVTANQGRLNYYSITSVPRVRVDGLNASTSYNSLLTAYNNRLAVPTDLSLDISGSWDPDTRAVQVTATATTTSAMTAQYVLHIMLTESEVYFDGTNGIDWHQHTLRDAFPGITGTPVSFSGEFPQSAQVSVDFTLPTGAPPHEYRPDFCEIVVFVQEVGTAAVLREVHQAAAVPLIDLAQTPVESLPAAPRLGQPFPNPFNPSVALPVQLAEASEVALRVLDAQGRQVRTLHAGTLGAGSHALHWDGRDDAGRRLGSGVYLAQLIHAGGRESRRLVLLK